MKEGQPDRGKSFISELASKLGRKSGTPKESSSKPNPLELEENQDNSNNDAFASLSQKLMQSEKNEHEMKSKMCELERRENELNERLTEQKQCYNDLVNQLEDHDLAVKKIASLEQENSGLLDQVEHLKEVERRFKEVHQSEEFLHGRVEELEQTESVGKIFSS